MKKIMENYIIRGIFFAFTFNVIHFSWNPLNIEREVTTTAIIINSVIMWVFMGPILEIIIRKFIKKK